MHDENKGMWCSLCAEHMRKFPPRSTFRTFRIQKYINKISIPFPIKDVRLFQ
jgi:hypothetical protein